MKEKVITAGEAAKMVESGMHLGLGTGMDMNPMTVVREIVKNGVKNLTLTSVLTGGYVADLLIGLDRVSTIQFPQIVMDEFGLAPNFRKMVESGKIQPLETM